MLIKIFVKFKCFLPYLSGLIIITSIWIVLSNLIAEQQERKIDQAKEQFTKYFSSFKANNSSLKLEELTAKLGINIELSSRITSASRQIYDSKYRAKKRQFAMIKDELDDYLSTQLEKPSDEIDYLPEKLNKYISSNTSTLEIVQNHIISSELPQWDIENLSNTTYATILPSYLSHVIFQKLLIVYILDQTHHENNKAALRGLEASWKLNQSLLKRPDLISQLVAIIIARMQAVTIRKMPILPPIWQSRIEQFTEYNLPKSFSLSLINESFTASNSARYLPANEFVIAYLGFHIPHSVILEQIYKPYLRLSAIDYWNRMNQEIIKLPRNYFSCSGLNGTSFKKNDFPTSWWNKIFTLEILSQWLKINRLKLQLELTQKVIEIKKNAASKGNWPQYVPNIESSRVCKDAQWVYKVSKKNFMSISLNKQFDWSRKEPGNKIYTPLNYIAKYKESLK